MRNIAVVCLLAFALCGAAAMPFGTGDLQVSSDLDVSSNVSSDLDVSSTMGSSCSATLSGGNGFIQIGNWRFGAVDANHFSFSSNNGRTAVILRSDGTVHGGNGQRSDWGLSHKAITWTYSASNPMTLASQHDLFHQHGILFGSSYVQFGNNCRLGTPDNGHLSVSFNTPCCNARAGIHTAGNDCF
jgi:hypothetical protein